MKDWKSGRGVLTLSEAVGQMLQRDIESKTPRILQMKLTKQLSHDQELEDNPTVYNRIVRRRCMCSKTRNQYFPMTRNTKEILHRRPKESH